MPNRNASPAYRLLGVRRKIFGKLLRLMSSMKSHVMWKRWEPTIGGCFPIDTYQEIIMRSERIMSYLTLMSYAATHPQRTCNTEVDADHDQLGDQAAGASDAGRHAQHNHRRRALGEIFPGAEPIRRNILSTLVSLSQHAALRPAFATPSSHSLDHTTLRRDRCESRDGTAVGSDKNDDSLLSCRDSPRQTRKPRASYN